MPMRLVGEYGWRDGDGERRYLVASMGGNPVFADGNPYPIGKAEIRRAWSVQWTDEGPGIQLCSESLDAVMSQWEMELGYADYARAGDLGECPGEIAAVLYDGDFPEGFPEGGVMTIRHDGKDA